MMSPVQRRMIHAGVLLFGFSIVGCDSAPPPPVNNSEPEKLSDGMEKMKGDMIKKMQNKELGKDVTKLPKAK